MNHYVARTALITIAFILTFNSHARAAEFFGLGFLPGHDRSRATAISADGSTVVGWGSGTNSDYQDGVYVEAFRWTRETGMVGLGDLPGGRFQSVAHDVSADGSVIVGESWSGRLDWVEAFRWTESDGLQAFHETISGTYFRHANAVSADGTVAVGLTDISAGSSGCAFCLARWDEFGLQVFPFRYPDDPFITAEDVSADGTVMVGYAGNFVQEAYRWTRETGFTWIGGLPGASIDSEAYGVSADGRVVVGMAANPDGSNEAFRWTQETGMVGLGHLPGGDRSWSLAVSDDGSLVVGVSGFGSGIDAVVWHEAIGIQKLQDVLIENYDLGDSLSGWHLQRAIDLSADGRAITGVGYNPKGELEAWIAYLDFPIGATSSVVSGDYNNNGQVEQADLDLVLLNWGNDAIAKPVEWTNDLPTGLIDQDELDRVLLNWGATATSLQANASPAAVPEPGSIALVLLAAICVAVVIAGESCRRTRRLPAGLSREPSWSGSDPMQTPRDAPARRRPWQNAASR